MHKAETSRIEQYLRVKFKNDTITVKPQALFGSDGSAETKDGSAEIKIGGEHVGEVYKDTEDEDVCYHVQITILEEDLES